MTNIMIFHQTETNFQENGFLINWANSDNLQRATKCCTRSCLIINVPKLLYIDSIKIHQIRKYERHPV